MAAACLFGSFMCSQAQNSFAPEQGDFSTEVKFSPFQSNGETFSLPALEVRYFLTGNDALTLELGLNGRNKKVVPNTDNDDAFEKFYHGTFSLELGYQRHFYNYKRVDLYAGGKIGYIHDFAAQTVQTSENNKVWRNSYDDYVTGNGLSVYLTTGIDFYIYKGLYVGAEINLGFSDVFAVNSKVKTTVAGTETEVKSKVGGHDFIGGFDVDPKIRLGWTF